MDGPAHPIEASPSGLAGAGRERRGVKTESFQNSSGEPELTALLKGLCALEFLWKGAPLPLIVTPMKNAFLGHLQGGVILEMQKCAQGRRALGSGQDEIHRAHRGRGWEGRGRAQQVRMSLLPRISLRDLPATARTHTRFAACLLALWGYRTTVFETEQSFETSRHHPSFHFPGSLKSVPLNNPKKAGSKSKNTARVQNYYNVGILNSLRPWL